MEDKLILLVPVVILKIAPIVILNLYATVRLWGKNTFTHIQKFFQIIIIWLIPIFGSLLILAFITDDETPKGPRNPNDGQGVDGMPGGVQ